MEEIKKARKLLIKAYNELGKSLNEVDILLKEVQNQENAKLSPTINEIQKNKE